MNNLWFASDLVCAVCKQKLLGEGNKLYCANGCSDAGYSNDGILYVLPKQSVLHQEYHKKISAWEIVQAQGISCYENDPVNNLAIAGNPREKYYKAFGEFCQLSGKTLDVGCGPSGRIPVYLQNADIIAGIDPLPGTPRKEIPFCQAIGEFLPFPDEYFDNVTINSVLDHVFAPDLVVKEAVRVIVPSGKVHICVNLSCRSKIKVRQFIKNSLPKKVISFIRLVKYRGKDIGVPSLIIPEGADGVLHMEYFNENKMFSLFSKINLTIVNFKKVRIRKASVGFFSVRKNIHPND